MTDTVRWAKEDYSELKEKDEDEEGHGSIPKILNSNVIERRLLGVHLDIDFQRNYLPTSPKIPF